MHIDDFDFDLPPQLVAQQPPAQRGSSRLLVALPGQPLADAVFGDLPAHIAAGDLLSLQEKIESGGGEDIAQEGGAGSEE